jgi:uncharacterized protein YciI
MSDAVSLHDPRAALRPEALQRVYLVFLYRGPAYTSSPLTPDERAMMDAHASYVWDLYQRGIALAAGPVLGGAEPAELVSMTVLRAQTAAEAERLAMQDPAVQGRHFRAVLRPWLLPAGM